MSTRKDPKATPKPDPKKKAREQLRREGVHDPDPDVVAERAKRERRHA